jgi:hypothetical protein
VWQELERSDASAALVRFCGGGGSPGSTAAVTLEDADKDELARWGNGEGELPEALVAPIWGRYALFRGHPRITGLLMWDVHDRQVVVAGERGGQKFDELLSAPRPPSRLTAMPTVPITLRDTSPGPAAPADQQSAEPVRDVGQVSRLCAHCGGPIPEGLRVPADDVSSLRATVRSTWRRLSGLRRVSVQARTGAGEDRADGSVRDLGGGGDLAV